MATRSDGERSRDSRPFDVTLVSEVIEALSTRAVGRTIALDQPDVEATVVSLDLEASDYSIATAVSSGLETGLATMDDVNKAALRGVDDPNPVRAGMRIFDALARGVDRAIEASPLNPLNGSIAVLESGRGEFANVRFGHWRATGLKATIGGADLEVVPGESKLRVADIGLTASLSSGDLGAIVTSLGHEVEGDIVIEEGIVSLRRRVGPISVTLPFGFDLDGRTLVVGMSAAVVRNRRLRLPGKLRRSYTVDMGAVAGSVTVESIAVRGSRVTVELAVPDAEESVTAQKVSELVTRLRGSGDLRLDRLS